MLSVVCCPSGMERLQPEMERVGVRWRQGPQDHADEDLEARRAHVQQVTLHQKVRYNREVTGSPDRTVSVLGSSYCSASMTNVVYDVSQRYF